MHVQGFCGFSQCPIATPVAHHSTLSILFVPKQSEFCSTILHHASLSPHTFDDENLSSTIVQSLQHGHIVESRRQSQFHTRSRCPDTCSPLRFPSILVLCQEEAMREPCLQPLRHLPIPLLMLMSLLQLNAATFSILIATPDSTEYMLEVVSFSAPLDFLGTPLRVRFAGTSSGSVICLLSPLGHLTLGTCLFTVSSSFRGPHIIIRFLHACNFCKVDNDVIRGSHKQLCINSTRWDFETTVIWIQMDGAIPGNQMITSHQWRNVTWSDALNSPLFHQSTQEHEVS